MMTEENKNQLKKLSDEGQKIRQQIENLEGKLYKTQVEAIKNIIAIWIEEKDFNDYCLTYHCENIDNNHNNPIFMELECFVSNTQDYVSEKREQLSDLIYDYSPRAGYHFGIKINDFVEFYGSDYDFGFKFAYLDINKIKEFAKEYNLILKCRSRNTVESYDEQIKKLQEEKDKLIKYRDLFV
jgi:hypothetical protein